MSRTLYVFVTSEYPDPYLSSVCHCIKYEHVGRVVFVQIVGLGTTGIEFGQSVKEGIAGRMCRRVQELMSSLARGEYQYFKGAKAGQKVLLGNYYSEHQLGRIESYYKMILNASVGWDSNNIEYKNLQGFVARSRRGDRQVIFDVTAIRKAYLADLIALCITEGVGRLTTFDFLQEPTYEEPWKMLIHELDDGEKRYKYLNLLETPVFREEASRVLLRGRAILILIGMTVACFVGAWVLQAALGTGHPVTQVVFVGGSLSSITSLLIGVSSWAGRRRE